MAELELHPEEILEEEFEYARETAGQAMNDRTAIVNMYLLLVGGVGSIVVGLSQSDSNSPFAVPPMAYSLLFGLLGLTGFFMVMKIVRLRQAWYESVRAMNEIKRFYIEKFPELDAAFLWKANTNPALGKPWTITFNLALLLMIIDSVAIAVAVYSTGLRVPQGEYLVAAFAAFLFLCWQLFYYFVQLPA